MLSLHRAGSGLSLRHPQMTAMASAAAVRLTNPGRGLAGFLGWREDHDRAEAITRGADPSVIADLFDLLAQASDLHSVAQTAMVSYSWHL